MANEMLTKSVKLGYKASSQATSYTDVVNVFSFPDLGGDVDKVEITNLMDGSRRYIKGLVDYGDLEFECYYSTAGYNALQALEAAGSAVDWQISLPDNAKFEFSGVPSLKIAGGGVGDALQFTVSIALSSGITFTQGTPVASL